MPTVSGATVAGEVLQHTRGDKVIAFKKRRRKNSRRKRGYRHEFSVIRITEILTDGAKPSKTAAPRPKREPKPKAEADAAPAAEAKTAKAKAKKPAKVDTSCTALLMLAGTGPQARLQGRAYGRGLRRVDGRLSLVQGPQAAQRG